MRKCPLLLAAELAGKQGVITEASDCQDTECRWYHDVIQGCEVIVISSRLGRIADALEAIHDRLPTPPTIKR